MNIVDIIDNDQEIQQLEAAYEEKYHKYAPPYNYDEYAGIDDYKDKLRKLVEES